MKCKQIKQAFYFLQDLKCLIFIQKYVTCNTMVLNQMRPLLEEEVLNIFR